ALAILVALTLGAMALVWLIYREEHAPPVAETNRRNFRTRLAERYQRRRDDGLREAGLLTLGLQTEAMKTGEVTQDTSTDTSAGAPAAPTLLASADILAHFDVAGGRLLVLGAPGAGKTFQLLDLGLGLLARDQAPGQRLRERGAAPQLPAPVLAPLASW